MKIGILGAGAIAREMAKTLKCMEGVCTYASLKASALFNSLAAMA